MQADFLDAHYRHWQDAEQLFASGRWANADHLYGVAAECGLKHLMLAFGMSVDQKTGRPQDDKDRRHINNISGRFESYRSGKVTGTDYTLPASGFFDQWDISDRYAHHSNFDSLRAQSRQTGAEFVCQLIKKAQRDGLL